LLCILLLNGDAAAARAEELLDIDTEVRKAVKTANISFDLEVDDFFGFRRHRLVVPDVITAAYVADPVETLRSLRRIVKEADAETSYRAWLFADTFERGSQYCPVDCGLQEVLPNEDSKDYDTKSGRISRRLRLVAAISREIIRLEKVRRK
jgi:hypothetical protein